MDRRRLLWIGFLALVIGIFAGHTVYRAITAKLLPASKPPVRVVVAARDLKVGSSIQENDLKVLELQLADPHDLPPNTFHQKAGLVGRGVITPIVQGDFISPSKLADADVRSGLPSLIPLGFRAFPVRASDPVWGAFITPTSRVDVLLTAETAARRGRVATTVLQNVPVVAADQRLDRASAGVPQANIITLLVSPQDAQKLALATAEGHIQLVLRNPVDSSLENPTPTLLEKLYVAPPSRTRINRVLTSRVAPPSYTIEIIRGRDIEKKPF